MTINLDRSIFNVFCQYTAGIEAVTDPATTRADVIDNILHGQSGFTDVVAVIEFNAIEGWSRNITADVMAEVDALREPSNAFPPSPGRTLSKPVGIMSANCARSQCDAEHGNLQGLSEGRQGQ